MRRREQLALYSKLLRIDLPENPFNGPYLDFDNPDICVVRSDEADAAVSNRCSSHVTVYRCVVG